MASCEEDDGWNYFTYCATEQIDILKNTMSGEETLREFSKAIYLLCWAEEENSEEIQAILSLKSLLDEKLVHYEIPDDDTLDTYDDAEDAYSFKWDVQSYRKAKTCKLMDIFTFSKAAEEDQAAFAETEIPAKEILIDKATLLDAEAKHEIDSKDLEEIEKNLENMADKKMEMNLEVEELKALKEDGSEYQKSGGSVAGLQESIEAHRLGSKLNILINQINTAVSDINAKEGHIREGSALNKDEASREHFLEKITEERQNFVSVVRESIMKLQKVLDSSTKFENIAKSLDEEKDGIIDVTDAMKAEEAKVKILEVTDDSVDNKSKLEIKRQEEEMIQQEKAEQERLRLDELQKLKAAEETPFAETEIPVKVIPTDIAILLDAEAKHEIDSKDLEEIEKNPENMADKKMEMNLEVEELKVLKEDVSEYQENLGELQGAMEQSSGSLAGLKESKAAQRPRGKVSSKKTLKQMPLQKRTGPATQLLKMKKHY